MPEPNVLTELKSFQGSLNKEIAEHKQTLDQHSEKLRLNDLHFDQLEAQLNRPDIPDGWSRKNILSQDIASQVIGSAEFERLCKMGRGRHTWLLGNSFFPAEFKTILSSAQPAGTLRSQRDPAIVGPGVESYRVRELIPRSQTNSSAVEYLKETGFTNSASPQVEGSAKSESNLVLAVEQQPVRTLAHWIAASAQILADLPQLASYINTRLMDGLKDVEDRQLLTGDGTGQNLDGLITNATSYDTSLNVSGDTKLDKLNHAMYQVERAKLTPSGIVLNPKDWRDLELAKSDEGTTPNKGTYIMGSPRTESGVRRLWDLPIATTTAMTIGTFLVADFRYTALYDRMDARIDISTEHADFFTRNLVAIRAEERLALVVFRSDALVFGSF